MFNSNPLVELRNRRPAEWLRERDMDLLICSELYVEEGPLQRLFIDGWNDGTGALEGAWVSHQDSDGETDIVVSFVSNSGSLVLLIENKIDAEFQPNQPERYRDRARRWGQVCGPLVDVETVLLAPAAYFQNEGSDIFDRHVSYEDLIEVLSGAVDARSRFLAVMLRNGLDAHREGYVPVRDEVTTQVWSTFWDIANKEAPRLRMRKPGNTPSGARFIYFYDADGVSRSETKGRAHIVYKSNLNEGCYVDAQFRNMNVETLEARVAGVLEPDMLVGKAGKSASIRIRVPSVNFARIPEGQEESILEGLYAAERLRSFFVQNGLKEVINFG